MSRAGEQQDMLPGRAQRGPEKPVREGAGNRSGLGAQLPRCECAGVRAQRLDLGAHASAPGAECARKSGCPAMGWELSARECEEQAGSPRNVLMFFEGRGGVLTTVRKVLFV
jgi:hypothetical protein